MLSKEKVMFHAINVPCFSQVSVKLENSETENSESEKITDEDLRAKKKKVSRFLFDLKKRLFKDQFNSQLSDYRP